MGKTVFDLYKVKKNFSLYFYLSKKINDYVPPLAINPLELTKHLNNNDYPISHS